MIGIPSDEWGEQVHAIVRLKEGCSVEELELIEHTKHLIAGYKCPCSVEFRNEPLPASGAGKILKRDLVAGPNGKLARAVRMRCKTNPPSQSA